MSKNKKYKVHLSDDIYYTIEVQQKIKMKQLTKQKKFGMREKKKVSVLTIQYIMQRK